MTIPHEDALAFFPRAVKVGNVTLLPLTLAGAVRLAEAGVDLAHRVPREKVLAAAQILARDGREIGRFRLMFNGGLKALSRAVETVLNDAFETFVKPEVRQGATISLTPSGLGWPLELAEFLCAEYGWTFDAAIHTSVATVYALVAAARQRHDGKHAGLDYLQRDYAQKMKRAKRHG